MSLSAHDIEQITKSIDTAIDRKFNEKWAIEMHTHREHHDFLAMEIERRAERNKMIARLKTQALGFLLLTGISGLGYGLYWLGTLAYRIWVESIKNGGPGIGN